MKHIFAAAVILIPGLLSVLSTDIKASNTFADISMSFFNELTTTSNKTYTECLQRYHTLTLSHRTGKAEASVAYNWLDTVDSATSVHTLTPWTVDASIPLTKEARLNFDSVYIVDVFTNKPVNLTMSGEWQLKKSVGGSDVFLSPGIYAVKRDDVIFQTAVGAGIETNLGPVKLKFGYNILDLKDYILLANYNDTVSIDLEIPTWQNTRVRLGINKTLDQGSGQALPIWFTARLLFDHFLGY